MVPTYLACVHHLFLRRTYDAHTDTNAQIFFERAWNRCRSLKQGTQARKDADLDRRRPDRIGTQSIFTMVLPLAAAAARRRFGMAAKQSMQQQKRGMAHAPAPEWEGIDKVVRGYFPQDYQRT